jgi:1,4-dihydroxy-2-naphthoyl-CoA hydrolase
MSVTPKRIWFGDPKVEDMQERGKNTMLDHCGIVFTAVGPDSVTATMPVDHRTKQPIGILHGGANVVLAETIASTAGNFVVDISKFYCVGLEINANHLRSAREGTVTGTCRPLHLGRSTQVWETRIEQDGKLMCISRMTLSVLAR